MGESNGTHQLLTKPADCEAEGFYREIIESSPIGYAYYTVDSENSPTEPHCRILAVNGAFEAFAGSSRDQIVGQTGAELIHGLPDESFDWKGFYGSISVGGSAAYELFSDRTASWHRISVSCSSPGHYIARVFDVTEDILRLQELEAFFDISIDLLCIAHSDGYFLKVNPAWEALLGFKKEELTGAAFIDYVHPEDREKTLEALALHQRAGHVSRFLNRYRCRDGTYRHIEWRSRTYGQLIYAVASDVTERIENEALLKRQSAYNRSLLEAIPDMIFVMSPDGVYREFKPGMGVGPYVPPEVFIGRHYTEVLPPSLAAKTERAVDWVRAGREPEPFEYSLEIQGQLRHYEGRILPMEEGELLTVVKDITERIHAHEALRESEAKYRSLFETTGDAILLSHRDVFLDCNNAALTLFRVSSVEAMKLLSLEALCPELQPGGAQSKKLARLYGDTAKISGGHRFEWLFIRPGNGEVFTADVQLSAIELNGERVLQYVIRDISVKKRLETVIVNSERNFRSFFETIGAMIVITDKSGGILFTNEVLKSRLGYTEAQVLSMDVLSLHPEECRKEATRIFAEMLEGRRDACPLPLIDRHGQLVPVETRVWAGVWDERECIFGVSKDLSKEQEALQMFNKAFDNNPALMAITDEAGRFLNVNLAFTELMGYSLQEVLGQTADSLALFPVPEQHQKAFQALMDTGRIENLHLQVKTKNGGLLNGLFSGDTIRSQGRTFYLTVMVDISGHVRAQGLLKEAALRARALAREAREASAAKSLFLANMSHEIRTPMNGLMGFVHLLEHTGLSREQAEYVEDIKRSSGMLKEVIDDILDMSKIEAGRMALDISPVDICQAAEEAVAAYAAKASEKKLPLYLQIHEDVPCTVLGDGKRLKQILTNLISNAVKFTERGEVVVTVNSTPLASGCQMTFTVRDTGIGISEAAQKRLFQLFVQGDSSTTRRHEGTGLGLSICRSLVTLMDGKIELISHEGQGSEFRVMLPFKPVEELHDGNKPFSALEGCRVMAAGASGTGFGILSGYLADWHCEVMAAASQEEVKGLLEKGLHPEALVLSLNEVTEAAGGPWRGMGPPLTGEGTALILVVPYGQKQMAEALWEGQASAVLAHPLRRMDLFAALKQAMGRADGAHQAGASAELPDAARMSGSLEGAILLVEDNPANQKVLARLLQQRGLGCDVARNGMEAVRLCSEKAYRLIFMDCQMPEMDGFEATRRIRGMGGKNRTVPIVALTAYAMSGDAGRCLEAGMTDYLSKPLNIAQLDTVLERYLKGRFMLQSPLQRSLDRLQEAVGLDTQEAMELLSLCVPEATRLTAALLRLVDSESLEGMDYLMHQLRGSIGNLRLREAFSVLERAERMLQRKNLAGLKKQLLRQAEILEGLQAEMHPE